MTKQETVKLFMVISAAYPREKAFSTCDEQMVSVWHEMLEDIDFSNAVTAIKSHISTSPFSPSISDLRKWASEAENGTITPADAWGKVIEAVKKYGYYQEKKAREYMTAPVWDVFSKTFPSWQSFCMSENIDVDRAHFMKMCEGLHKNNVLPVDVKNKLSSGNRMLIGNGNGKNEQR